MAVCITPAQMLLQMTLQEALNMQGNPVSQLLLTTVMSQAVADAVVGIVASTFETSDSSSGQHSCELDSPTSWYWCLQLQSQKCHLMPHEFSDVSGQHQLMSLGHTKACVAYLSQQQRRIDTKLRYEQRSSDDLCRQSQSAH